MVIAPRQQDPNDLHDKFRKRSPLEFTGTLGYTQANEWMVQIEKIFMVFQCTGRQQVQLAAYMFRKVAEMWWRTIEPAYERIEDDVLLATFKAAFNKKFIADHKCNRKLSEIE